MNWNKKRQKGMSFLEVVVAMLVIGVALAGSLAMIQASNRFATTAELTSIAQQKAQDLIDKMRVNSISAQVFLTETAPMISSVNNIGSKNRGEGSLARMTYPKIPDDGMKKFIEKAEKGFSNSCFDKMNCTPDQYASAELYAWLLSLQQELPGSYPIIQPKLSAPTATDRPDNERKNEYVISIIWKVNGEESDNAEQILRGITVPFTI